VHDLGSHSGSAKMQVFSDVMLCRVVNSYRRFEGTTTLLKAVIIFQSTQHNIPEDLTPPASFRIIHTAYTQIFSKYSPQCSHLRTSSGVLEYDLRYDTSNSLLRNITDDSHSALCGNRCSNVPHPQGTRTLLALPLSLVTPFPLNSACLLAVTRVHERKGKTAWTLFKYGT
jgi:hypothetical protein